MDTAKIKKIMQVSARKLVSDMTDTSGDRNSREGGQSVIRLKSRQNVKQALIHQRGLARSNAARYDFHRHFELLIRYRLDKLSGRSD